MTQHPMPDFRIVNAGDSAVFVEFLFRARAFQTAAV